MNKRSLFIEEQVEMPNNPITIHINSSKPINVAVFRLTADNKVSDDNDIVHEERLRNDDGSILLAGEADRNILRINLAEQPLDRRIIIALSNEQALSEQRKIEMEILHNDKSNRTWQIQKNNSFDNLVKCPIERLNKRNEKSLIIGDISFILPLEQFNHLLEDIIPLPSDSDDVNSYYATRIKPINRRSYNYWDYATTTKPIRRRSIWDSLIEQEIYQDIENGNKLYLAKIRKIRQREIWKFLLDNIEDLDKVRGIKELVRKLDDHDVLAIYEEIKNSGQWYYKHLVRFFDGDFASLCDYYGLSTTNIEENSISQHIVETALTSDFRAMTNDIVNFNIHSHQDRVALLSSTQQNSDVAIGINNSPAISLASNWMENDKLANKNQHQPIEAWFAQKNLQAQFDYSSVDMRGYFGKTALTIGTNYRLLKDMLGKMNWAYRKNNSSIRINLKNISQKENQQLHNICRMLHKNTFIARYNYHKEDKNLYINLQLAQPVRQFISGGWLEWYALAKLLEATAKQPNDYCFSCARGVKIHFTNGDQHELDVVFLPIGKMPLIIECKSGEYRNSLEKCLTLRKRIDIPASHYLILATDLDYDQAQSLSATYQLSFVNPDTLIEHCLPYM